MPMHPAAPDGLSGLLDAFDQTVQAVIDLGWSCRDDDFATTTARPGWTIKEHISHVVATERTFAALRRREAPVPEDAGHDEEQLRDEFVRAVEADVLARNRWSGREVVTELADFHPERMRQLREYDADVETVIGGVMGADTTFGQALRARISDVWVHEQDIRGALGRPGDLDSPAAAVFTAAVLNALPRIAAVGARIDPGQAVVFDVTGPVQAREGVRVRIDEHGNPWGALLFSGKDRPEGDEQLEVTTIQLTTDALTRRAAGRRSTSEIRFTVNGDEELAQRLLDALVIVS